MAVEIYRRVQGGPRSGQKLTKAMAWTHQARRGLGDHTRDRAARARGILNSAKKRTGSSQIIIEAQGPDLIVSLTDERGQGAANIIEFGRHPFDPDSSASYAVAPLGRAFAGKAYKTRYGRKGR